MIKIQREVFEEIKSSKKKVDMGWRIHYQGQLLEYNVNRGRVNLIQESGFATNSWFADRTGQVNPPLIVAAVSELENSLLFSNGVTLKTCCQVIVES